MGTTAQQVADVADEAGMFAVDIIQRALNGSRWARQLLKEAGLKKKQISQDVATKADYLNAKAFREMCERYGANKPMHRAHDNDVKHTKKETTDKNTFYGYHTTKVIRWMGKEGWNINEAKFVLTSLDITVTDATIRTQLRAGRKGERGAPAPLTQQQSEELESLVEKLYET